MGNDQSVENRNGGTRPRILLADDSKLIRVTATKLLAEKFDLILAEDGEEAWRQIGSDQSIQVVFTDLGMPKLDGYGLIQRIRQSETESIRNLPVIVITGAGEDEGTKRKVFELGATDFIAKPFKSTEVVARAEAHASYRRDKSNLEQNVDIDLLTGALNKQGLQEQLERDVSFVNRHGENLAVMTLELDGFDAIYQRLGKNTSEQIIKQTATLLLKSIRKEDSLGRDGLARFVAILPMAKSEGVLLLARRLCERIKQVRITLGGEALQLTLSAGIAVLPKGKTTNALELLATADQALTNARALGPGEVQFLKLEGRAGKKATSALSIDNLLEAIAEGRGDQPSEQEMDAVVQRLAPLIALMSERHRRQLLGG